MGKTEEEKRAMALLGYAWSTMSTQVGAVYTEPTELREGMKQGGPRILHIVGRIKAEGQLYELSVDVSYEAIEDDTAGKLITTCESEIFLGCWNSLLDYLRETGATAPNETLVNLYDRRRGK
jgi:hypothetical protein